MVDVEVHVGAEDREVTAHRFQGDLIAPSAHGNQSLIQGKDWVSLKAELSMYCPARYE